MKPEIIASLPPVTIGHVAEGPNAWTAFDVQIVFGIVALAVGVATLVVACWTLSQVWKQIRLALGQLRQANRQIGIANRQLGIAEAELTAVRDDFALSQKQFQLAQRQFDSVMRAPMLEVEVLGPTESVQFFGGGLESISYRQVSLLIALKNVGNKVADRAEGCLFIPLDTQFKNERLIQPSDRLMIDGKEYIRYSIHQPLTLRQGEEYRRDAGFMFDKRSFEATILWRAWDAEYTYPSFNYGKVHFDFTLPIA